MRKFIISVLVLFVFPVLLYCQDEGGMLKTSIVMQRWDIEKIDDSITEATMPIEFIYPLYENLNIQVSHFPALSQFGKSHLAALSDTWVRSTYSFANDQALVSFGLGLPTGKTKLDSSEIILARLLSEQSFKFQLPVYGQGLSVSSGIMYAYPIMDNLTIGGGMNFVFRGKYRFSEINTVDYNPGDQLGLNIGFDYMVNQSLSFTSDFVYNYYTADKLGQKKVFISGPQFSTKLAIQYQNEIGLFWLLADYQTKAKNSLYAYLNDELKPEPKNSNITLREINVGGKFSLSEKFFLTVVGEIRSYVENEYKHGWVDLFGGGFIGEYSLTQNLIIFSGVKLLFGDREMKNTNPSLSGKEFQFGTQWNF